MLLDLHRRYQKKQHALPDLENYLLTHGMIYPACYTCGETTLKEAGLGHGQDPKRIISCSGCGTMMYRFYNPDIPSEDKDWDPC